MKEKKTMWIDPFGHPVGYNPPEEKVVALSGRPDTWPLADDDEFLGKRTKEIRERYCSILKKNAGKKSEG